MQVCQYVTEERVRQIPVTTCKVVREEHVEPYEVKVCRIRMPQGNGSGAARRDEAGAGHLHLPRAEDGRPQGAVILRRLDAAFAIAARATGSSFRPGRSPLAPPRVGAISRCLTRSRHSPHGRSHRIRSRLVDMQLAAGETRGLDAGGIRRPPDDPWGHRPRLFADACRADRLPCTRSVHGRGRSVSVDTSEQNERLLDGRANRADRQAGQHVSPRGGAA